MLNEIILLLIIIAIICYFINSNEQEKFDNLTSLQRLKRNNLPIQTNDIIGKQTDVPSVPPELIYQNQQSENNMMHYSQAVALNNQDLTYYYNDVIDQSKISLDPSNIINQTNKINYYDVKTGIDKCREECNGVCYELGYTGSASCYDVKFDNYGSFYKNPSFINGLNANPQSEIIDKRP